jgi:hypothetical protein
VSTEKSKMRYNGRKGHNECGGYGPINGLKHGIFDIQAVTPFARCDYFSN